jgi:hypothetical protein
VRYPDGSILHEDGTMLTPEGKPHQNPIPVESSATERLARDGASSPPTLVHADQPVPTHVGGGSASEAASHAGGPGPLPRASHDAAHVGGHAGHSAPTASHQPGHTGHGGAGTATAPTTHDGPSGGGDATGSHDTGGHGGDHGPADFGTGHGSGGGSQHGHQGDQPTHHTEEPPGPRPSGHIPERTFNHVLRGELKYGRNGEPRVVGYHFRPGGRDPYRIKVPKILEIDHKTGLTQGNVWMRNALPSRRTSGPGSRERCR